MATERTDSAGAVAGLHRRSAAERIHETVRYLLRSWELYVFVLPAVIHVLLFRYLPIYGLRIAFTDETLQEIRRRMAATGASWLAAARDSHEHGVLAQDRRLNQLFHLVTHGIHHRGQLLSMITLLGYQQPFEGGDYGGWSNPR